MPHGVQMRRGFGGALHYSTQTSARKQSAAAAVRLGSALACARVLGHTDLHVVVIAASTDAATPLVTRQLLGLAARIRLTNQTLPLQSVIVCGNVVIIAWFSGGVS
jgi:hypothetical protein